MRFRYISERINGRGKLEEETKNSALATTFIAKDLKPFAQSTENFFITDFTKNKGTPCFIT